jgi:hypothetical protein
MSTRKACEGIIDFIAAGTTPHRVIAYQPFEAAKTRGADLIYREKTAVLTLDEKSEVDYCLQLEHIMRLTKVRARQFVVP